jgi:transcriptional regulator
LQARQSSLERLAPLYRRVPEIWAVPSQLPLSTGASLRFRPELPLLTEGKACTLSSVTVGVGMSKPSDLVQGTLDLLLLKILALQPLNGFAVSQHLKQISGDVLQVSDGSLYPALHKLEQEGWITAEWKLSENNRRAKFYSLTRLGRRQLEREAGNWNRLSAAISHVVKLEEA